MLSRVSINEAEAENHLRQAYRVAGLEPVPIRWFDSPIAFVQAHLQVGGQVKAQVGDQVWYQLYEKLRAQIRAWVGDQIGDQVWDQVGAQVRDQIRAQFGAQVWRQVGAQVGSQFGAQVSTPVWYQVMRSVQSYSDEPYHSFSHFFHEIFEPNDLIHLALFSQMVSGFHLGSKEAWLVRKPIRMVCDEQGRLHSASGMCVQYQDGWGFYAWHGVRCSKKIALSPEHLTRQDWIQEDNLELRRLIQERLGNDRFVSLVGGSIIDRGKRGDLVSMDLLDDPEREARFVHVRCPSTARHYYLRVPPTIARADEAVAWTFGLEAKAYQPLQET